MGAGITYEVALQPDAEILGDFEAWLEYHVDEMLALPGFRGASIHKGEEAGSGAPLRIVRYELEDRAALQRYLEEHAPRMRAEGAARFGGRFRATRRIVEEGRDAALTDARPCPNCDELLWGQYCANCGQRARARMITFWELLKDAGELVASLDSRMWRTLGRLMLRPGRLTVDYLRGRRARYVPPMRLFIVSSIVFFFIANLNARLAPDGGALLEPPIPGGRDGAAEETQPTPPPTPSMSGDIGGIHIEPGCQVDYSDVPDWFARLVPAQRAEEICQRITVDRGRSFMHAVLSNIPAMMFLFLPVMAFAMKLAYPLSGRYYAEHLLFLVHYHSFFFLLNTTVIVLSQLGNHLAPGRMPDGLLTTAAFIYIPIYLFRAMRVVYGQGFLATAFKYVLLGLAYFVALIATLLGVLVYTAVTL